MQTAAEGQWMEGLLREVLPRDMQDGASAKKEDTLLLTLTKGEGSLPCTRHCYQGFLHRSHGAPKQHYAVKTLIIFIL
jgi:hypothetical protein